MASSLGLAILSALSSGIQGFNTGKATKTKEKNDLLLDTERILESRKGRRETIAASKEEGQKTRDFQGGEGQKTRDFQSGEGEKDRAFQVAGREDTQANAANQSSLDRELSISLENLRGRNALAVAGLREDKPVLDVNDKINEQVELIYNETLKTSGAAAASEAAAQGLKFWSDFYARTGPFRPTPPITEDATGGPSVGWGSNLLEAFRLGSPIRGMGMGSTGDQFEITKKLLKKYMDYDKKKRISQMTRTLE